MPDENATPPEPKWGDPIANIPPDRQAQLTKLAEAQRAWLAATGPDRDPEQSPFARAGHEDGVRLTGAEVFFLAVEAIATERGSALDKAERTLREKYYLSDSALHLEGANLGEAHLEGANLGKAHLEGATLYLAHLEGADLEDAHLEGAILYLAHLESASLIRAHLEGANLRLAFFSTATNLAGATVADKEHGAVWVADVRWQEVNLAIIRQWREIAMLGDELRARELAKKPLTTGRYPDDPLPKGASRADRAKARERRRGEVLAAWQDAARAYRQLASVMRAQGMNDEADRFAYRGQLCQRQVYRYGGEPVRRGFSWFLDAISGYGYKPQRSLFAYLGAILGFAALFLLNSHFVAPHLAWNEAIVLSMSSFHGRGFFNPNISLGDTYAQLAALEAFVGLVIEVSFIATFTQRFFGR